MAIRNLGTRSLPVHTRQSPKRDRKATLKSLLRRRSCGKRGLTLPFKRRGSAACLANVGRKLGVLSLLMQCRLHETHVWHWKTEKTLEKRSESNKEQAASAALRGPRGPRGKDYPKIILSVWTWGVLSARKEMVQQRQPRTEEPTRHCGKWGNGKKILLYSPDLSIASHKYAFLRFLMEESSLLGAKRCRPPVNRLLLSFCNGNVELIGRKAATAGLPC